MEEKREEWEEREEREESARRGALRRKSCYSVPARRGARRCCRGILVIY